MGGRIFAPSLFFLLAIASSVLAGFWRAGVAPGGWVPAAVTGLLAVASLGPVCANSLAPLTSGRRIPSVIALLAVTAVAAVFAAESTSTAAPAALSPGIAKYSASVLSADERRHGTVAVVRCGEGEGAPFIARAYLPPGTRVSGDDVLSFSARPHVTEPRAGGLPDAPVFYLENGNFTLARSRPGARERFRGWFDPVLARHFDADTAAVVRALYYGNTAFVPASTIESFRKSGLLHALAASGENIGLVAAFPLLLLGLLKVPKKIALFTAGLAVFMYLAISDLPVSLLRAGIMFFACAAQMLADREKNPFNALYTASAIIILALPSDIYNAGFHLSAGATMGILTFHESYRKKMEALPAFVARPLSVTLAAQAVVLPLVYLHMHDVNLTSLVSGLAVTPLLALLMVLTGVIALVAAVFPPAGIAAVLCDLLWKCIAHLVNFFALLGGHFHPSPADISPGLFIGLLACFLLFCLPLVPVRIAARISLAPVLCAVSAACLILAADRNSARSVAALNHGNGVLFIDTTGSTALVAGSPPRGTGLVPAVEMLRRCGPDGIRLVVTSTDAASIAGYLTLIRKVNVTSCVVSSDLGFSAPVRKLYYTLERERIPLEMKNPAELDEYFPRRTKKILEIY